jgi:hypothetical protein
MVILDGYSVIVGDILEILENVSVCYALIHYRVLETVTSHVHIAICDICVSRYIAH